MKSSSRVFKKRQLESTRQQIICGAACMLAKHLGDPLYKRIQLREY
jgi:hypothetical protein